MFEGLNWQLNVVLVCQNSKSKFPLKCVFYVRRLYQFIMLVFPHPSCFNIHWDNLISDANMFLIGMMKELAVDRSWVLMFPLNSMRF